MIGSLSTIIRTFKTAITLLADHALRLRSGYILKNSPIGSWRTKIRQNYLRSLENSINRGLPQSLHSFAMTFLYFEKALHIRSGILYFHLKMLQ